MGEAAESVAKSGHSAGLGQRVLDALGSSRRRRWLAAGAAVGIVAGIIGGLKVADYQRSPRAAAGRAWHGRVDRIVRSGADANGGLRSKGTLAWATVGEGSEVGDGMQLATDARTRARIVLDDGTVLLLDRDTEIDIGHDPRNLAVPHGALVADVAHLDGAPNARLTTPNGDLSVIGTKFVLTATEDRTSVEVLRGSVQLKDPSSDVVEVNAGQEGVASTTSKAEVTPANDLAQRVAFGERLGQGGTSHNEDADAPVSGLGELRARRPGKTDEKDHAVRLASHVVKVRIVGNVARTEVDESFANDTGDDLEGIYRFPLPPGAQIERLALEVDGKLVDGAFVDKAKAAAIWRGAIQSAAPKAPKPQEEIIWVPGPWRDPALLEWQRGGRFELKIFPIPKRGSRRIVIAYTESVPSVGGLRRYVYPLPQGTASDVKIDSFAVDVQVLGADPKVGVRARGYELTDAGEGEGAKKLTQTISSFTPSGDLAIEYALASDRTADVSAWGYADPSQHEDAFVALALRPKLPRWADVRSRDQVLVVDVGRAMFGERLARAGRLVEQIAEEMDRRDRMTVLACDVTCRTLPGGWKAPGAGTAHDVDAFLAGMTADGASDLVGAMRAAAAVPGHEPGRDLRVVLVSDGVASAGYRRAERLATEVARSLPDARAEVVAVPVGTDADIATLQEVARGGGGVLVAYAPGEPLETAALDVLNATYGTTLRDAELTMPDGLHDVAPAVLGAIRAGSETLVAMRMIGDHVQGDIVLRGKVGGDPFEARYPLDVHAVTETGNAFVPRLYAGARIADRERDGGDAAKPEIVALSQRFAVPSRFTSLLVLEGEAMFDAFGIHRDVHAPSWTGESAAVSSEVATKEESGLADNKYDDTAGGDSFGMFGVLGGAGNGSGGGGKGASFGSGGGRAPAAKPQMIAPNEGPSGSASRASPASPAPSASAPPPADASKDISTADPFFAPPARRPRSRGQWMKREWFRTADVTMDQSPPVAPDRLASARAALLATPDARGRHKDLVRLLALDGSLDELEGVVAKWSVRDPLDADAIAARAELLARRGDRDAALRVMSGIAVSLPASQSEAAATLSTLALAHERAGKTEGCAFRVAAAELRPDDVEAVARAAACERNAGRGDSADAWIAGLKADGPRAAVTSRLAKLATGAPSDNVGFGDVVVDASWDRAAGADLDIAIIDPAGNRVGWSGRTRGARVQDPTSRSHEALALSSSQSGPFVIELDRADPGTTAVRGTVTVRSLGQTLHSAFVVGAARVQVARINVRWDSRLVAIEGNGDPNCDPPFDFDANGHKRFKPECIR